MRAIYAVHLAFAPGVTPEEIVRVAGAWPCRGRAPEDLCTSWEPGRRSYEVVTDDFGRRVRHNLAVEVLETPEGRLWETSWRHPHADDEDLHMVNDVAVAEFDGEVTASLVIRTVWARPQVSMPRFSMRAPRLVRDLLSQFEARDGAHRLLSGPRRLDAADTGAFVEKLLLDPKRTRPVVFVSDDPLSLKPLVDPAELARELAGMAHVFYSLYGHPGALISQELGTHLGCRNGAMRIWWPGLTRNSEPYDHRLYSARSLRDWHSPATPVETVFRTVSVASATNAAPPEHSNLRRAARRAALAATTDTQELAGIAELALAENDRLVEQLKEAEDRAEMALLEHDDTRRELEELREDKRRAEREMAKVVAHAASQPDTTEFGVVSAERSPKSVLEAVQQAQPLCPHLDFADRAFESAADCPYEFPEDILDDLLKLERLAELWARPEGIGGMDMAAKAGELGLHWRGGVSETTTGGTKAAKYEFLWRGEKRRVGPHTRRDRGSGAGRIARIYLDKHEPADPTERRLIVGIVGKKLEDSTTG